MNLAPVDWAIVVAVLAVIFAGVAASRSRMRSVADFLAAGRSAGRYLVSIASGIAGLGAISIVGLLEMNYVAGFSMAWWGLTMGIFILVMTVSGWVIYRFRRTRSLTLAEFFERRYSKHFRVFAGLIAFLSGVINFGIFPAVGARFFIYYCGFPQQFGLLGLEVSTFPVVMIVLLSISLYFVFAGGQVAVIVTDFIQGTFVNIVFVAMVLYLMFQVDWSQMVETLNLAPANSSLINPFKTGHVADFNLIYFVIGIFGVLYGAMSWQGTQGYNASASSAHEAKMAGILGNWRGFPQGLFLMIVPIIAYTVMRHPDFAGISSLVDASLSGVASEPLRNQLRTPLVLTRMLPPGLMGAFAAVMLAAFISTHDTYLHSWGSIFIQDVVMPLRKRPLSQKQHLRILRIAIFGVACFIFCFSLLFQQSGYIFLFFAITGAIFAGGSGAVIIGGLYWKRGTTAAAWAALITGSSIAVGGILIHQLPAELFAVSREQLPAIARAGWAALGWLYEINGQQYWAVAMFGSSLLYVAVSLLGRRVFDLEGLLNRGDGESPGESRAKSAPSRGWRLLGMGTEFSRGDRIIVIASYCWTGAWTLIFIAGTIWNLSLREPPEEYLGVAEPARSALLRSAPLIDEGQWEEAAALLAPHADPESGQFAKLQQRYGLCLQRGGRSEEALPQLERAVELSPEFGRAWVILAEATRELGLIERSQQAAELAVTHLDPVSRGWGRYWRFFVFLNLGMSLLVIIWFTTGGVRDIRTMFGSLDAMRRDVLDDGRVRRTDTTTERGET